MKALIIHFSLTGRTKMVAEAIASELSKYEVKIEAITYNKDPKEWMSDHDKTLAGDLSNFKYNELIFDPSPYDLICIGVPTHGGRPAYIFDAYIQKSKNFDGKRVVVFNTCRLFALKTLGNMKSEVEKKGGNVTDQKCFKGLFKLTDKKAKEFGKFLNQ
jgi:flavodoxin